MSRILAGLCALVLGLTLQAAPGLAGVPNSATVPASIGAVPSEDDSSDTESAQQSTEDALRRADEIAATTSNIQQDLSSLSQVQAASLARLNGARATANRVSAELKSNEKAMARARRVVGVYMRSIYINGPTELTVIASLIDSENPGDLVQRADDALRVGDHKDDVFDEAVELLKRTEDSKTASDVALAAARISMNAVDDQVNGLRQQRADAAGDLADQIGRLGALLDPEQVKRNSDAALSWANYLGKLASWKVPPITFQQMQQNALPKGLVKLKKQPGVAMFRKGRRQILVLPERTIASVTYAVSRLGTKYQWQANTASEMDCSALVDRSWNVPGLGAQERNEPRALVPGGARGLAERSRLLDSSKRRIGDLVFLSDAGAGVNHVGIAVTGSLMVAADPATGAVNAIPIDRKRAWKVGRLVLPEARGRNAVPGGGKKQFQCGADPASFISLPDGGVLASPKLCPPVPGVFSEAHMQHDAIRTGRCIGVLWPQIPIIGGWRPSDPYPDHPSGRALDVMMPGGCSADPENVGIGNQIAQFIMANAEKFNVKYFIWQQRIWTAGSKPIPLTEMRMMGSRGGCTVNHMDHVHITMNGPNLAPGISQKVTKAPDPAVIREQNRAVARAKADAKADAKAKAKQKDSAKKQKTAPKSPKVPTAPKAPAAPVAPKPPAAPAAPGATAAPAVPTQ